MERLSNQEIYKMLYKEALAHDKLLGLERFDADYADAHAEAFANKYKKDQKEDFMKGWQNYIFHIFD